MAVVTERGREGGLSRRVSMALFLPSSFNIFPSSFPLFLSFPCCAYTAIGWWVGRREFYIRQVFQKFVQPKRTATYQCKWFKQLRLLPVYVENCPFKTWCMGDKWNIENNTDHFCDDIKPNALAVFIKSRSIEPILTFGPSAKINYGAYRGFCAQRLLTSFCRHSGKWS